MAILSIKNLSYSKHHKLILQGVCLDLEPGKIVALLGANGAGKTTLMRIISGQAKHWHGQVTVDGQDNEAARKACISFTDQLSGFNKAMKISQVADFDVMARKRIINSILLWKNDQSTILLSDHFVNEISSVLDEVVIVKDQTVLAKQGADDIRAKGQSIEQYYESFYQEGEDE
ncbi:MAG: ABC transporter ATP-binding protein [Lactobacillus sp.]|jgi:ABC-2 type transport system ATP-binding protein|nr:ABC transporter ATP-binding protein [Lactobacillus sp.]MCI1481591.1 ABC transporter ATP-binding protein [Lactobacillus sp.]